MYCSPFISTDRNSHENSYRPSGSAEVFTSIKSICLVARDGQSSETPGIGVPKVPRTHNSVTRTTDIHTFANSPPWEDVGTDFFFNLFFKLSLVLNIHVQENMRLAI